MIPLVPVSEKGTIRDAPGSLTQGRCGTQPRFRPTVIASNVKTFGWCRPSQIPFGTVAVIADAFTTMVVEIKDMSNISHEIRPSDALVTSMIFHRGMAKCDVFSVSVEHIR